MNNKLHVFRQSLARRMRKWSELRRDTNTYYREVRFAIETAGDPWQLPRRHWLPYLRDNALLLCDLPVIVWRSAKEAYRGR